MPPVVVTEANFEAEVLGQETPVLIDFWATWCAPCKMLSPLLDKVAEERTDIKIVKINVEDEPNLAHRFAIRSLPTLIIADNGVPSATHAGAFTNRGALNAFIDDNL